MRQDTPDHKFSLLLSALCADPPPLSPPPQKCGTRLEPYIKKELEFLELEFFFEKKKAPAELGDVGANAVRN